MTYFDPSVKIFPCFRSGIFLPRVNEERNLHDLEYPDIPSIPEENEDDFLSTPSCSPINFSEFSPESAIMDEKRDSNNSDLISVMPWRGILKKTNSRVNLNE